MRLETVLKRIPIIGAIIAIVVGIIFALDALESNLGFIDWLITKVAPALPSRLGDLVIVVALYLFIRSFGLFEKALDRL